MEKTKNVLFDRDFSKPVFTIVDTNTKKACTQCAGKGKLKVKIGTSTREALCALCDGSGAINGIAKAVAEMQIRQIDDKYIVEGNRREVTYHLQNRLVRSGAIFTRTNNADGVEVFDTKKQAELVLKAWLEDEK